VLDWLQPDWVLDTKDYKFHRGDPRQIPRIELEIITTNQACWKYFKPHYYLDLPEPPAAQHFVGLVDGELACHVVVSPMFNSNHYRMTRLVTMPEWQGAGVGMAFLNWIAEYHLKGHGRKFKKLRPVFHTSHPQLIQAMRRSPLWVQTSARMFSPRSKKKSFSASGGEVTYGANLRAIQGFQYIGGARAPKIELEG
jgi:GNAT superfamily N-acetyltransferase